MSRIACPTCAQALNVPAGARAIRCPACKSRIDLPATPVLPPAHPVPRPDRAEVDEPPPRLAAEKPRSSRRREADEGDDCDRPRRGGRPRPRDGDEADDDRPRRRKASGSRREGPVRGVIPLVVFGPACVVLMAWAPFSGYGTALGMLVGALAMLVAIFGLVSRYFKDPVLTERVGDPNGVDAHLRMIADCVPASFAHPRRLAGWVIVEVLGFLVLVEAMCTAAFLKTMDEPPPGAPGPNPPGQQAGPGPNPPPAEKTLTDDEVVTRALADLASKEPGADWRALEQLTRVAPNPRRAEVLQGVTPLTRAEGTTTRTRAIQVVGAWGTAEEVPLLIDLARDRATLEEAMRQLARFHDPRAIPVFVQWMNDYEDARKGLVGIGSAAEPALLPFLGVQADFLKQGPALKVLKEIGTQRSVPYLQALARLNDGVRSRPAQDALDAIAGRAARARRESLKP